MVCCQLHPTVANAIRDDPRFVGIDRVRDAAAVQGALVRSETTVNPSFLEQFPSLRFVARLGSGLDRVDVDELQRRGIVLVRNPAITAAAVAELAALGLVALARRAPIAFQLLLGGVWGKEASIGEAVRSLDVAIWGGGPVGQAVFEALMPIAGTVSFVQWPSLDPVLPSRPADDAVRHADAHVMCLPLRPPTRHLVGPEFLSKVAPRRPYVVNVARYEVVDVVAAIAALDRDELRGLYVDPIDSPLPPEMAPDGLRLPRNLFLTPHIGAQRADVMAAAGFWGVRQALDLLDRT